MPYTALSAEDTEGNEKNIYISLLLVALLHVSFYLKKYVYNIYIYNIWYKGYVPWRKERNSGKKCVEWAF